MPDRTDMWIAAIAVAMAGCNNARAVASQGPCDDSLTQGMPSRAANAPGGRAFAETIRGRPGFPIPWIDQVLPWSIDVTVEMHQVSYQP